MVPYVDWGYKRDGNGRPGHHRLTNEKLSPYFRPVFYVFGRYLVFSKRFAPPFQVLGSSSFSQKEYFLLFKNWGLSQKCHVREISSELVFSFNGDIISKLGIWLYVLPNWQASSGNED